MINLCDIIIMYHKYGFERILIEHAPKLTLDCIAAFIENDSSVHVNIKRKMPSYLKSFINMYELDVLFQWRHRSAGQLFSLRSIPDGH